ncbi:MAG TPA: hypothetical protein PLL95_06115, partial [Anaerolineales bacterium]|nr:hypothetical protein [Anaerolineales bacterium]
MVKTKFVEVSRSFIVIAILIWLAIAALGTIFLPGETGEIREMFAFSQIIPILVAAFYFGQTGGLLAAFAASVVSGSLVIANIDNIDSIFVQRVMFQIISFNSVALLTSFLSDQAKAHRRRLTRQVERLNALRAIDKAIISGGDLSNTLYILLESLTRLLNVEAASIFLFNPKTEQLRLSASLGFFGEYPHQVLCNLGEGMVGQAAAEKHTIYHHNLEKVDKQIIPAVKGEGVMDYYAVP